nr:TraM recognition domain-containing protein [Haloactinopolyspora sp.]
MSTPNNRRRDPGGLGAEAVLVWVAIVVVVIVVGSVYAALHLGHRLAGTGTQVPADPFSAVFGLLGGDVAWPGAAGWWVVGGLAAIGVLLAVLVGLLLRRLRRNRTRVDRAASYMGRGRDVEALTRKNAQATARRLGVEDSPGVPIGRAVGGGQPLFGSWEDMHIDIWGPRTGKALVATTPVLTPNGWTPIGDLARGCRVIGRDGQPHTVTGVFPQGVRPAYRMTFSDGTSILCDAEHIWTVRPKLRADKRHPEGWREWTTQQLLDNGLRRSDGAAKYYLPIVRPVEFDGVLEPGVPARPTPPGPTRGPGRQVRTDAGPAGLARAARATALLDAADLNARPLDPYLLGALIGDGGLTGPGIRFSTADAELMDILRDRCPERTEWVRVAGAPYDYQLRTTVRGRNSAITALRSLGLWGAGSLTKHVPDAYLLAPIPDRWALLAGLLDTDGSIDSRGIVEFCTSSPRLARDVRFLVQALGGTVTTTVRETTHAPSHRLFLRLPADSESPFWLTRKRERWEKLRSTRRVKVPTRAIVSIEPAGEAEMVCISVDAPDQLYVAQECIVTHNTTSRAVPAILDAPGGVLVTSNKRDVVDATRDVRAKAGPVWVFDPQAIALEEPTWWWNPLSYVTDEVKAAKMAEHFAAGSRDPGAKTDAYFDPAGQDLLAGLLLAAALDGRPITDVYTWLTRPTDDTAVDILREHGFTLTADQVAGVVDAPEKQRGGVFGTAQQMASCLTNRQVAAWVTAQGMTDRRPHFDPETFVREGGTLYSLSKEGRGTAGPLVTALTVAVVEAAEELAATSPGGRLRTPLLGVLDEAANVCRWRELPNLYSHYGSRGIVLMTILQSWSQGVEVWGEAGMKKLWSAANIKVYGGGVSEAAFLEDLSRIIGDYDRLSSSTSYGRGQRTVSQQLHRERILDVADLAALPKGRAVVLASGSRPTLIRTQPWMTGPHAAQVRASIAAHDPQAERTIREAETELAAVDAALSTEKEAS